ncbi:MAG: 4-alpha-glucanotransferase [Candidatus Melainabacteria bacterium]|nr:4-alpha-glucanotransferase [Candidatus Melainabacteria bacterium]
MPINPDNKIAGVLIPAFALRRDDDLGIGDTLAMKDAVDFCARNNITVLQTLPINETSGDNSPYNAISATSLEPSLLAMVPDVVPGLKQEHLLEEVEKAGVDAASNRIDYDAVRALKLKLLFVAFRNFEEVGAVTQRQEFEKFKEHHAEWLSPYSLFRTIMAEHNGNPCWTQWDKELQTVAGAEKWLTKQADKARLEEARSYWQYVQWVAYLQWDAVKKHAASKGVRLMGDIPFGVSRYSADVWSNQNLFDLEWAGGAPPEPVFAADPFTKKWGQNWGIPIYDWQTNEKENFKWWKQRVLRNLDHFHDYRIDHVLGFFRVYAFPWIPERNWEFLELTEEEAEELTDGKLPQFLPRDDETEESAEQNKEEGSKILKVLGDTAHDCNIVAEDLGIIVPEYLRPALHELGMAGFAIPIFERIEETREFKPMGEHHPLSLATYATHDHQPIAAYYQELVDRWHGEDGEEGWKEVQRLMRLLDLDDETAPLEFTEDLHESFIKALFESPCWLAVFMITDLLATTQRFNQPGLSGEACWTERLAMKLSDFEADPVFGVRVRRYKDAILDTKRLSSAPVFSGS